MIRHISNCVALAILFCGIGRTWASQDGNSDVSPRINTTATFAARESMVRVPKQDGERVQLNDKGAWKISITMQTPGLTAADISSKSVFGVKIGKLAFYTSLLLDPTFKEGDLTAKFTDMDRDVDSTGQNLPIKCQFHFLLDGEVSIKLAGGSSWIQRFGEGGINIDGTTLIGRDYLSAIVNQKFNVSTPVVISFDPLGNSSIVYTAKLTADSAANLVVKEVKLKNGVIRWNVRERVDTKSN